MTVNVFHVNWALKKTDIKIYEHCLNQLSLKPEECGIRELQGEFAVDNPESGRVMEKLGMSFLQETEYTKWDGSATFKAKIYSSLGQNGTKHI